MEIVALTTYTHCPFSRLQSAWRRLVASPFASVPKVICTAHHRNCGGKGLRNAVPDLLLLNRHRDQPPHIRGGKEVQDHLAASLAGEEVPDFEPVLISPCVRPKGLLLGAVLERVFSRLGPVWAPPAPGGGSVLGP